MALRPLATNEFEQFRYSLLKECPHAAYWLESMVFGMMAQLHVDEPTALELACKIVAHDPAKPQQATQRKPRRVIADRMPRNTPAALTLDA